jgi:hypothetical protein
MWFAGQDARQDVGGGLDNNVTKRYLQRWSRVIPCLNAMHTTFPHLSRSTCLSSALLGTSDRGAWVIILTVSVRTWVVDEVVVHTAVN